ncbi:MAG: TonB-dependent receptor [Opitutaceae bacterium]|nr:TonB-dependent receptor [Opitutaceae bacterium]
MNTPRWSDLQRGLLVRLFTPRKRPARFSYLASALLTAVALGALAPLPARAADAPGTITGRVQNIGTHDYLNNARVTIDETALDAFTNQYGEYRLTGVPAGTVKVRVFYTGLESQVREVTVPASGTVQADFDLRAWSATSTDADETVVLDKFVTSVEREMDPAALAVNEQRFAPSLRNVVSADQFGDVTEGNVGEFVKFLPGITIDYTAADARTISVRGLPSNNTPVTVDGVRMASAASSAMTRTFELEQVSINNVSRVEVTKVPTPDLPADMLGGAVNLVSTSAFERSKPQLRYRAYYSLNSESRELGRVRAPGREPTHQVRPGFDFRYVNPISENFGFTLNALNSNQYNPQYRSQMLWVPHYTGVATVPEGNPYLSQFQINDIPKTTERTSLGGTFDWRVRPQTVLTFGYQHNDYDAMFGGSNLAWNIGTNPTSWGPNFVQGRNAAGNVTIGTNFRRKYGTTDHLNLKLRHAGDVWKIDGGAYFSRSINHYRDIDKGFFENVQIRIPSVAIRFRDIAGVRPTEVTATNSSGILQDPFELDNYRILTARSSQNDATDVQRGATLNLQRSLDVSIPLTLKAGLDVRESDRDIRYPQKTYNFVGADGIANTADDNAGFLADLARKELGAPYGFATPEWPNTYLLADHFRAHPEYFRDVATTTYSNDVRNSKKITERITAGYLRLDTRLLNQRLWLVGGVRYERTDDKGEGFLDDINAVPPSVTDPLEKLKLQLRDRGSHTKANYDGFYPSLNATYSLAEGLLLRVGYASTIGRPDFNNIVPGATIPDSNVINPTIVASNPTLRPWLANNYDITLQYYFASSGSASIGVFQKDFSNFFGSVTQPATPELLTQFGLDPGLADEGYQIRFLRNVGEARVTGIEMDYTQPLDDLGRWGKGFTIFANGTLLQLEGSTIADFRGFIDKNVNWGVSWRNKRLKAGINWNYRGEQRLGAVTGTGIPPGTYDYQPARLQLDANFEYTFRRWLSFFATARNLTDVQQVYQRYAPGTPKYAYQFRDEDYGIQITIGVKGTF